MPYFGLGQSDDYGFEMRVDDGYLCARSGLEWIITLTDLTSVCWCFNPHRTSCLRNGQIVTRESY